MKKTIIAICLMLTGCASIPGMPGHVTANTSKFDNTVEIAMAPTHTSFTTKFGLLWNSALPPGQAILSVYTDGTSPESAAPFEINIDGIHHSMPIINERSDVFYSPSTAVGSVYIAGRTWLITRYITSQDTIRNMINAKSAVWRLHVGQFRIEGDLADNSYPFAKQHFKDFLEKVIENVTSRKESR